VSDGAAQARAAAAAEAALATLDRRAFLRSVAVLAAAGLVPAGCGGVPPALAPAPDRALLALSPRAYATFQAFAMRLAGPRAAAAIAAGALDPAGAADAWVARLPALGGALGQGLALLEWGVWPLLPKLRPFTGLDPGAQDRVIGNLQRSRLAVKRDLYRGLKSLATLGVFSAPAARSLVGFPGPFDGPGIAMAMSELEEEPPAAPREGAGSRKPPASPTRTGQRGPGRLGSPGSRDGLRTSSRSTPSRRTGGSSQARTRRRGRIGRRGLGPGADWLQLRGPVSRARDGEQVLVRARRLGAHDDGAQLGCMRTSGENGVRLDG
jgi:hypothetical protein